MNNKNAQNILKPRNNFWPESSFAAVACLRTEVVVVVVVVVKHHSIKVVWLREAESESIGQLTQLQLKSLAAVDDILQILEQYASFHIFGQFSNLKKL